MELSLEGKTALVTGASRGIGLATARLMAESGARVMLTSRKAEALEEESAGIEGDVAWFAANAGDPAQAAACVEATMERFGSIDVLVNNAGTNPYFGKLADLDVARAEKTVQVNQTAVLVWTQLAYRASMSAGGGSVVNVASVGAYGVEPQIGWYNVTKAAVVHLTRQLAADMAPVRVNAVAPGLVKTYMARALWEGHEDTIGRRLPLRRLGVPEDIAKAAVFLASDAADWITGTTLVVDGGSMVTSGASGIAP